MFDIGFWEVGLILLLALLILGPERLPKAARTIGFWVGRARGAYYSMRSEMDREFQVEEMRKMGRSFEDEMSHLRESGRAFEQELSRAVEKTPKGPVSEIDLAAKAEAADASPEAEPKPDADKESKS